MVRKAFIAVIVPVLMGRVVLSGIGCASGLKEVESLSDPSDDAKLSKCRAEGRAARQTGDEPDEAYEKYLKCTLDAGLR